MPATSVFVLFLLARGLNYDGLSAVGNFWSIRAGEDGAQHGTPLPSILWLESEWSRWISLVEWKISAGPGRDICPGSFAQYEEAKARAVGQETLDQYSILPLFCGYTTLPLRLSLATRLRFRG